MSNDPYREDEDAPDCTTRSTPAWKYTLLGVREMATYLPPLALAALVFVDLPTALANLGRRRAGVKPVDLPPLPERVERTIASSAVCGIAIILIGAILLARAARS